MSITIGVFAEPEVRKISHSLSTIVALNIERFVYKSLSIQVAKINVKKVKFK